MEETSPLRNADYHGIVVQFVDRLDNLALIGFEDRLCIVQAEDLKGTPNPLALAAHAATAMVKAQGVWHFETRLSLNQ